MGTKYWSQDLSVTWNTGLRGWEDNIETDVHQLGCDSARRIYVCRDKIQKHAPVNMEWEGRFMFTS